MDIAVLEIKRAGANVEIRTFYHSKANNSLWVHAESGIPPPTHTHLLKSFLLFEM